MGKGFVFSFSHPIPGIVFKLRSNLEIQVVTVNLPPGTLEKLARNVGGKIGFFIGI